MAKAKRKRERQKHNKRLGKVKGKKVVRFGNYGTIREETHGDTLLKRHMVILCQRDTL